MRLRKNQVVGMLSLALASRDWNFQDGAPGHGWLLTHRGHIRDARAIVELLAKTGMFDREVCAARGA